MNTEARAPRPATHQDVIDAPPHMVAEIAGGRLHLHPRPAMRHARASFRMAGRLDDPFQGGVGGPGGWWFTMEPEMPVFPDAAAIDLAPDWVCELLGPSTRRFDLTEKREIYRRNGVAHLWLVDPEARTLEAFALVAGAWTLTAAFQEGEEVRAAPFEALGFPLGALWPD